MRVGVPDAVSVAVPLRDPVADGVSDALGVVVRLADAAWVRERVLDRLGERVIDWVSEGVWVSVDAWDGETLGLPLAVPSCVGELLCVAESDAVGDEETVPSWVGELLCVAEPDAVGDEETVPSCVGELLCVAEPDAVGDEDAVADMLGVHDAVTVDVCEHEEAVAPASQHAQAPEQTAVDRPVVAP